MSPGGRTTGSSTRIDERLARLAPATSPDPERLAAARAMLGEVLDDRIDGTVDGDSDGSGSSRSRRVGDAHVLDLDDARHHRQGDTDTAGDAPLPLVDDDVVVPLGRGRTARERRRRRVQLGAAAAGVVGVVAVGLVLVPKVAPGPASPADACAAHLTASAAPEGFDGDTTWSPLAQDRVDDADLTLLRSSRGWTGFCADARNAVGASSTSTLWTTLPPEAEDGEPTVGGVSHDEWYVAWGSVGSGARAIRLYVERPEGDGSGTSGRVVDVVLDGAGWTIMLPGDRVPAGARVSLLWKEYGVERSLPLSSAWPEDGEPETSLTEQRRRACTDGPDVPGLRPLIEKRYEDVGLTTMMNDDRELVACLQDVDPPYQSLTTTSGPAGPEPARDRAVLEFGGTTDRAEVVMGFAGEDVARVELETEDGTVIPAELSDGYWVAWSTAGDGQALDEAWLVWYLDDGSRHED